jgi:HEAT repeat protein
VDLTAPDARDDTRAEASTARLRALGHEPDVAGLAALLREGDLAERSEAAFLLGHLGDPAARDALRAALDDGEARVRVEAALALARLGDEEDGRRVLRQELGGQLFRDAPVRAARALALLGDPAGYPRVVDALESPLPSNRMEAIATLPAFLPLAGSSPSAEIDPVAALARASRDEEPILRQDARAALAAIDDPRAAAALRDAEDEEPPPGP